MHITEMDLFTGLNLTVMAEIVDTCAIEETMSANTVVFREGDAARHLFILGVGSVDLKIAGDTTVYSLGEPGDVFGWSSMVLDASYTATAVCRTAIKAIRIDTRKLNRIFDANPMIGLTVYRRLSQAFNTRLACIYQRFLSVT
jgi:CRP-like cAMP-binding protein